jgi:hypothetical protein
LLRQHYLASTLIWPSPTSRLTAVLSVDVRRRDLHQSWTSPNDSDHPLGMPFSLPRWIGTGATSASSLSVRPSPLCRRVGIHNLLSRPVRALLTLRPVQLLTHLKWALSRGSNPDSRLSKPPVSYRAQPAVTRVGPSPTGYLRLWGALHRILCTRNEAVPTYIIGRTPPGTIARELKQTPWQLKLATQPQRSICA